jgi:hypothetical protein
LHDKGDKEMEEITKPTETEPIEPIETIETIETIKLSVLYNTYNDFVALTKLVGFSSTILFKLAKLKREIDEHVQDFDKIRIEKIKQYGDMQPDKHYKIEPESDNFNNYITDITEIMNKEIVLNNLFKLTQPDFENVKNMDEINTSMLNNCYYVVDYDS